MSSKLCAFLKKASKLDSALSQTLLSLTQRYPILHSALPERCPGKRSKNASLRISHKFAKKFGHVVIKGAVK